MLPVQCPHPPSNVPPANTPSPLFAGCLGQVSGTAGRGAGLYNPRLQSPGAEPSTGEQPGMQCGCGEWGKLHLSRHAGTQTDFQLLHRSRVVAIGQVHLFLVVLRECSWSSPGCVGLFLCCEILKHVQLQLGCELHSSLHGDRTFVLQWLLHQRSPLKALCHSLSYVSVVVCLLCVTVTGSGKPPPTRRTPLRTCLPE